MKTARDIKRQERTRNAVPSVAIAGYTNAGKSSLLNRLTGAGVLVENALFATLDPTVRKARCRMAENSRSPTRSASCASAAPARRGVPIDAGGGRRRRPDPACGRRFPPGSRGPARAVREVFADIDASHMPELVVINKCDLADPLVLGGCSAGRGTRARVGTDRRGAPELVDPRGEVPHPDVESTVLLPSTRARSSRAPRRGQGAHRGARRGRHPDPCPRGPRWLANSNPSSSRSWRVVHRENALCCQVGLGSAGEDRRCRARAAARGGRRVLVGRGCAGGGGAVGVGIAPRAVVRLVRRRPVKLPRRAAVQRPPPPPAATTPVWMRPLSLVLLGRRQRRLRQRGCRRSRRFSASVRRCRNLIGAIEDVRAHFATARGR